MEEEGSKERGVKVTEEGETHAIKSRGGEKGTTERLEILQLNYFNLPIQFVPAEQTASVGENVSAAP